MKSLHPFLGLTLIFGCEWLPLYRLKPASGVCVATLCRERVAALEARTRRARSLTCVPSITFPLRSLARDPGTLARVPCGCLQIAWCLGHEKHTQLKAAYSYWNVATTVPLQDLHCRAGLGKVGWGWSLGWLEGLGWLAICCVVGWLLGRWIGGWVGWSGWLVGWLVGCLVAWIFWIAWRLKALQPCQSITLFSATPLSTPCQDLMYDALILAKNLAWP